MGAILLISLLVPLAGTVAGAACVYLVRGSGMNAWLRKWLTGMASGVMVTAAVWSLLLPALESDAEGWAPTVLPVAGGLLLGMGFLLLLDRITPHIHADNTAEGPAAHGLSRTRKLVLAITLHNIPEGMAIGVALAAVIDGGCGEWMTPAGALALALGIALQNVPEGAIVAVPLRQAGNSRTRAFGVGVLSGVAQPVAAVVTMLAVSAIVPVMPWLLSFAAGAMLYVVVEELIPETAAEPPHSNAGTIGFAIGFTLMLLLETLLDS